MDFLFLLRVSGVFRADGAPPFVRALCCPRPSAHSDPFALLWTKGSRVGGGFRKGGTLGASLAWRSFGTFLSTGREKYIDQSPDKSKLKARRWIQPSAGFFYVLSMISLPLQRYTSNTPVCFPLIFSGRDAGFFSFSSMAVRAASSSGSWYSHSMGAEDILR